MKTLLLFLLLASGVLWFHVTQFHAKTVTVYYSADHTDNETFVNRNGDAAIHEGILTFTNQDGRCISVWNANQIIIEEMK